MYSYDMHQESSELLALIAEAENGEIKTARKGLRQFVQHHPSTLLAWKWLADIAENAKERSGAIRRAQLLAPGDPWVIEAKKHRRPLNRSLPTAKPPTNPMVESTTLEETVADSGPEVDSIPQNPDSPPTDTLLQNSDKSSKGNTAGQVDTDHQNQQPLWIIWVAAALGFAGIALLITAWQLGSF